ncbi:extracellular solute-binding protein [Catenuloplanes niger JCM 9533]
MHPATHPESALPARPHRTLKVGRVLRGLAATAVALPLIFGAAACGDSNDDAGTDPNEKVELSVFWWGDDSRAETTKKVLDAYTAAHPNVTFVTTFQGNQGYLDKLSTQAAGGNAPDIFQLDDNMLSELAERKVTLDLTPYVEDKTLDLSKFPESLAKYGVVDGEQAGVALAENTPGLIYNKSKLKEFGVAEPTTGMTWEAFITWAKEVSTKSGGKMPGTMDPSADYKALWVWLRQQGKEFYNGKELGFTAEDLTRWFELWKGARDSGATPTADVIHEGNSSDASKQLVVTGKAATSWVWSNQLAALSKNTKDELGLMAYPGDPSGQWARASMYWSGSSKTKYPDVVADVINYFVNDATAAKTLGIERGITPNLDLRKEVEATLTDANQKTSLAFETEITPKFGAAPTPPPKGHAAVRTLLVSIAESVQYGKATPAQAAQDFLTQAAGKLG